MAKKFSYCLYPYLTLSWKSIHCRYTLIPVWAIFCLSMRRWYERCLPFSQMNSFENSRLKVNSEVVYENSNRKIETSRKKRWGLHEFFSCASFCKIFFLLLFLCRKICFVVPFPHPLKKIKRSVSNERLSSTTPSKGDLSACRTCNKCILQVVREQQTTNLRDLESRLVPWTTQFRYFINISFIYYFC